MRLLLAEDERSLSKAIVTILEKNNYSADAVYDGVEALEYLESGNYDGLILDIMMPRMDGADCHPKRPPVPYYPASVSHIIRPAINHYSTVLLT